MMMKLRMLLELEEGQKRRGVWKKGWRGVVWESMKFLEYMEENCKCFFVIFNCIFQLADMILKRHLNMLFYKSQLNFRHREF